MTNYMKFGFLPEEKCYSGGGLIAEPLPNICEQIAAVWSSKRVDDRWLYPPLVEKSGRQGSIAVPDNVYVVPETHYLRPIRGSIPEEELCELIISVMGFFKGLRLIPEGWNHFYRTPISIGQLVDFYFDDAQMGVVMARVVEFWAAHVGSSMAMRIFGALHWHLTSQSYEHDFELFSAQYIVLDTCWRIFCGMKGGDEKGVKHAERPVKMCEYFGMPIPDWAVLTGEGSSVLSVLRNNMLHEGYYAEGPIGFEYPQIYPDIDLELRDLNSRLLLAILGFKTSYIQAPIDRSRHFRLVLE